jgi:hypothetical protein
MAAITDHTLTEDSVTKSKECKSEIVQYMYVEKNCEGDDHPIKFIHTKIVRVKLKTRFAAQYTRVTTHVNI